MTKTPTFPMASVCRAILAAKNSGLTIAGISADGTVLIGECHRPLETDPFQLVRPSTKPTPAGGTPRQFPYLAKDRDRWGTPRLYVRRHGRRIRIHERPGTTEFLAAYDDAIAILSARTQKASRTRERVAPGTLKWLFAQYVASTHFRRLDSTSQRTRRRIIEECLSDTTLPDSKTVLGNCTLKMLAPKHLVALRDRRKAFPGSANNRLKYLSSMLSWAVENAFIKSNPARDVKRIKFPSAGFHTWTIQEVRQFERRHPIGTKARLAFALLLFLGVRRGDVVQLGPGHIADGWIKFVPSKTRYMRASVSEKPILSSLKQVLEASPHGDRTFLITNHGKPFTAAGFGAWFRKRCDEARLANCTAHGLRKVGASVAADEGASDRQLMALFDWSNSGQATVYTQKSNKRRLAADAALLIDKGLGDSK